MQNVDRLLELFDDETVSWDAARAVGKIPGTDKVLTKRNHAILRVRLTVGVCGYMMSDGLAQILYAQKYYQNT